MKRGWRDPFRLFAVSWLVLLAFVWEEVTLPTALTVLGVLLLRWRQWPHPRWLPKALGLSLFALAFWRHGRHVNPEMGLNLMLAVVALKMLEAREGRDWRMLTLGSFLLWATGALFIKTPFYFLCALLSWALTLWALVEALGEEIAVSWRELARWILRALPLAVILFFALPRFSAGLWSPPTALPVGQVGFSEEAKPGEVDELRLSRELAFHATVTPRPGQAELYWRGMTLSGHDGWNWFPLARDEDWGAFAPKGRIAGASWWHQDIIHRRPVRRAFGLDWPQWWESQGKQAPAGDQATLRFPPYRSLRRYRAVSTYEVSPVGHKAQQREALVVAKSLIPAELLQQRPSDPQQALGTLAGYFQQQGFSYTLSPGKLTSLAAFLRVKKGWCSHYASSSALVLRAWGFPARLVSGYLGGNFNDQGQYFSVSEDDAHVWVEVWDGQTWLRVDPTLWIVPERAQYDGAQFFARHSGGEGFFSRRNWPDWVQSSRMWLDSVNYRFLVWSEEFDRDKQRVWAGKFDWNLSTFYMAGLLAIVLGVLGYWLWELWRMRERHTARSERLLARAVFERWLQQRRAFWGAAEGPRALRRRLADSDMAGREKALAWLDEWEQGLYAETRPFNARALKRLLR